MDIRPDVLGRVAVGDERELDEGAIDVASRNVGSVRRASLRDRTSSGTSWSICSVSIPGPASLSQRQPSQIIATGTISCSGERAARRNSGVGAMRL